MGSRIRRSPKHIFDCFLEVAEPSGSAGNSAWILQSYPTNYKDKEADRLRPVPNFVYPCPLDVATVQHYSFVMTDGEAKWTFGFCRQAPRANTALVILSSLPWHETFYKVLNQVAELLSTSASGDPGEVWKFLEACHSLTRLPDPGKLLHFSWTRSSSSSTVADFTCPTPDPYGLPSIPENRNLTEYFNAVGVDTMLVIFAAMLYERRIVITSRKLPKLSACVQAANLLIYPMNWQHLFIPVLPRQLIDYLSAPMPFLIGVPSPIMQRVRPEELGEVVLLDADSNKVVSPFTDLHSLPLEVIHTVKKALKNHGDLLGDTVARAFLQAVVYLIGGYKDALKFRKGEKITFHEESFVISRPVGLQPFLRNVLQLQIFRQFVEERLQMLNDGKGFTDPFEREAARFSETMLYGGAGGVSGPALQQKITKSAAAIGNSVKKEGGAFVQAVKNKANPAFKQGFSTVRSTSRSAYKGVKSRLNANASKRLGPPGSGSSSTLGDITYLQEHGRSLGDGHMMPGGCDEDGLGAKSAPTSPSASRRPSSVAPFENGGVLSSTLSSASSSGGNYAFSRRTPTAAGGGESILNSLARPMELVRQNTDIHLRRPVLSYERFDPPPISQRSFSSAGVERSPEFEGPHAVGINLVNDMQEVIHLKSAYTSVPRKSHSLGPPYHNNYSRTDNLQETTTSCQIEGGQESHYGGGGGEKSLLDDDDLISFGSGSNRMVMTSLEEQEVVFDPLLEVPSVKDSDRLKGMDASDLVAFSTGKATATPPQPPPPQPGRRLDVAPSSSSRFSKSSENLLKEYGLDFSKLSVAGQFGAAQPQQPFPTSLTSDASSRHNNGALDTEDFLAGLDPLGPSSSERASSSSAATNDFSRNPVPPVAPPRGVKKVSSASLASSSSGSQPGWTTFD